MEFLYIILLFPLTWPWIAKKVWNTDITWQEMGLNIIIITVACIAVWQLGRYAKMADTEIWNGQVIAKEQVRVSCEHSYQCHCKTNSKGSSSCDTCYEHINDWDWMVRTTAGDIEIDRIDRRGSDEPPRWTSAADGQPVALPKSFDNYVKAAQLSVFHEQRAVEKQFVSMIPQYPNGVYDYHYVNRVLPMGVNIPDIVLWNNELALMLRSIGPSKQANVVIVFVNSTDATYADALNRAWLGGKKNDVIVVVGTTKYPAIDWVRVLSWTDEQIFKVQLRDELLNEKTVDRNKFLGIIAKNVVTTFKRKHMKDFEYLKDEIDPDPEIVILVALLATLGSLGLTAFFYFYEVDLTDAHNIIRRRIKRNIRGTHF
jgi:hypothetical protein